MKETVKTSRTAGYIEKMFRALNADSFGNAIPEPIITLKNTTKAYGHCTTLKVWHTKQGERFELNISSVYLARPIEELVATLIHEMVHLYNMEKRVKDTSRGYVYHNKRFKEEAEKHMISIEHNDKIGWSITKPTEELLDYIISKGWSEIQMTDSPDFAQLFGGGKNGTTAKPTISPNGGKNRNNSIRHQCPKCGAIARTTKDIPLICGKCKIEMNKSN